jgi:hypothetical protein
MYLTDKVVEPGIHRSWEMVKGFGVKKIPTEVALLHHYRHFTRSNVSDVVYDPTARDLFLKLKIHLRVQETFLQFRETCGL